MKKTIENSLRILSCLLMFVSCDDYLNVEPEDKYLEETAFSTEATVYNVVNGIYLSLTENSTYGGHLTMSTVDVLAQRYNISNRHTFYDFAQYNYDQTVVRARFDNIWTNMYIRILNINKTIENLDVNTADLPTEKLNILKGEMLGLRAMLHFDLLRLYGPVYSVDPSEISIPYYNKATTDVQPFLPATEAMGMILEDISTSISLLSNDPVRTFGIIGGGDSTSGLFYNFRHLRFNYFAAKALEARIQLYAGNDQEALAAAKAVIDEGSQWFDWVNSEDINRPNDQIDKIFSSEVLFSLQNINLYTRHNELFASTLTDFSILATRPNRLLEIYEGNLNDVRYSPNWKIPEDASKSYETFLKFQSPNPELNFSFRFSQPLIRMSEMYYIAAETETDITTATAYLNDVRNNRGLPDLDPTVIDMPAELLKAYKKEFYGEGQLFYFYKRNNMATIEDGASDAGTVEMDDSKYVLPVPQSETAYRDNQD